jgi:hypothetical protein
MINLKDFLLEIGDNKKSLVNQMERIIIKLIKNVMSSYKMDNFWITIRVTLPNHLYDLPRWHKDGAFFLNNGNAMTSKFVAVLKGPGTLVIKSDDSINQTYNTLYKKQLDEMNKCKIFEDQIKVGDKYRPIYSNAFKNEKIIKVKNNQALIFFAGTDKNNSCLHSEPPINKPRLFISILPGSMKDIMELKERWK